MEFFSKPTDPGNLKEIEDDSSSIKLLKFWKNNGKVGIETTMGHNR